MNFLRMLRILIGVWFILTLITGAAISLKMNYCESYNQPLPSRHILFDQPLNLYNNSDFLIFMQEGTLISLGYCVMCGVMLAVMWKFFSWCFG